MAQLDGGTDTLLAGSKGRYVHANGIDIHCVEAGAGEPVILVDNSMVSTNPIWAGLPFAYVSSIDRFAEHFRVIVPDTRGSGRTIHPGGPISHELLADDVAALIDALGLDRPLICGFSDGGEVATVVGIRHPGSVRAIVNHGGYDLFNPDPRAPTIVLTPQMLGTGGQSWRRHSRVSVSLTGTPLSTCARSPRRRSSSSATGTRSARSKKA
jgi:pimeloyl-ACP methyl ester carboxylesterase